MINALIISSTSVRIVEGLKRESSGKFDKLGVICLRINENTQIVFAHVCSFLAPFAKRFLIEGLLLYMKTFSNLHVTILPAERVVVTVALSEDGQKH